MSRMPTVFNAPAIVQNGTFAMRRPQQQQRSRNEGPTGGARAESFGSPTAPASAYSPLGLTPDTHGGGTPFTPTLTQWGVNAAKGAATIDPHFTRSKYFQPGLSSMSPNSNMAMLPEYANSFVQQGQAAAMIPFSDALANNQFALGKYNTNAQNNLGIQNIAAGSQAANQSALLTLLNAMLGG